MNDVEFAKQIKTLAVDQYLSTFEQALENGAAEGNEDPFVKLFASLNRQQQTTLLQAIRQVSIDAISQVLGIIDGTSSMPGVSKGLELRMPSEGRLDGDLQSEFLILFEDE